MRTDAQTTNLALVAAIDRGSHNLAAAIAAGDQRAVRLAIALVDATDQPGVEVDDWMLTQQARRNGRLWISTCKRAVFASRRAIHSRRTDVTARRPRAFRKEGPWSLTRGVDTPRGHVTIVAN